MQVRAAGGLSAAIRFVADGRWRGLFSLAGSSYLSGLLEAGFLLSVTQIAFAINEGADEVEIVGRAVTINQLLVVAVVMLVGRTLLALVASRIAAGLMSSVVATTRSRLMRAYVTTSYTRQSREKSGALHELMTTFSNQASGMISGLSRLIIAAANLLALLGLAVLVDPAGAGILLATTAVLGLCLLPLRRHLARRSEQSAAAGLEFATAVSETAELGLELHVFDVSDQAADRVDSTISEVERRAHAVHFVTGLVNPVYTTLAFGALVAALAVVSTAPGTDLAALGAVTLLMLRSLSYGQGLQQALATVHTAAPFMAETEERLERYGIEPQRSGTEPVEHVDRLAVRAVDFRYPDGTDVLHDIDFSIGPSEIVGMVGPSGAGKSTLVHLLLGITTPTSGQVLADGCDISTFRAADWARRATFVPQAPTLISGTVADNIRFFRPGISDDEVERAATLAHIHEDIVGMDGGYRRQVGKFGGELSGGQRQRICIARALVERPDLLILDEPTSALDVRSEHLVRETLVELAETTTIVVIAHRLSTLDICNRIMVLQNGRIQAFESPGVLESGNEFYRDALVLSGMR